MGERHMAAATPAAGMTARVWIRIVSDRNSSARRAAVSPIRYGGTRTSRATPSSNSPSMVRVAPGSMRSQRNHGWASPEHPWVGIGRPAAALLEICEVSGRAHPLGVVERGGAEPHRLLGIAGKQDRRGWGRRRGRVPAGCARGGAPPARSPRARSMRPTGLPHRFAEGARRRSLRRRRSAPGRALPRRGRAARARALPLRGAGRWSRAWPPDPRARRPRRTSPWGRPGRCPRCGRRRCTRRRAPAALAGRREPESRWRPHRWGRRGRVRHSRRRYRSTSLVVWLGAAQKPGALHRL